MIPLNRSQCHGLDLDRHLVLDAGAGTGKTTVMSVRYIEHILSEDQRASRLLPMGPREAHSGQGALRIPRNQQQELEEWGGLLPPECVAITFTVKAAAELKERIRSILASLASTLDGDPESRFDPRLRKPGFVEQLMSLLDSAPIGTIDSFLSRLVAPHLSLVSDVHASETMSEEDGPMLNDSAISLFWSLQSEFDALDAGMTGDILSMLQSRDRLALMMGGRKTAAIVINGLIGQTLFVEEAENAWFSHAGDDGLQTSMEMLRSLTPEADALIPAIRAAAHEWMDVIRGQSSALKLGEGLAEDSRIRAIDELLNIPVDAGNWSALLWLHHLLISMTSMAQYLSPSPVILPKGQPPKGAAATGWGAGIQAWGKVSASSRDAVKSAAENAAETIRNILSTPQGLRLRVVARSAALFDTSALRNPAPIGSKMNPRVISELPSSAPEDSPRMAGEMQVLQVEDMFRVLEAIRMIRSQMKRRSGIHDHSDMQRLAEDLLLSRCPDVCRTWYPRQMVDELDSMTDEPWSDVHIRRALLCETSEPKAVLDLEMRLALVKRLRRKYRAFIIDEFQDTNPQQWRLLARLWGRREAQPDDPEPPCGDWEPTICLVGDVKQSIYRFRQAQVSVMRNAIHQVRRINRDEATNETRIADLRPAERSRDTRPRGGGWKDSATFVTADSYESSDSKHQYSWWRYDLEDDGSISNSETTLARSEGHIDLSRNHRTDGGLLNTINSLCEDIFSPRHHGLEGDWYARAQTLVPHHHEKCGNLEWLLPIPVSQGDPGIDFENPLDAFTSPRAKSSHLENEMIAQRLHCLINGLGTQISSPQPEAEATWVHLPIIERVAAEDILVLLPTRTHLDDLMGRLEAWGVPATADKMGPLLKRPSVRALRNLVAVISDSKRRDFVVALARSTLLGWDDLRLTSALENIGDKNPLDALIEVANHDTERELLQRWQQHSRAGTVLEALQEAVDHSDLLLAHPEASARNEIEMFLDLVRDLRQRLGGDVSRINSHLEKLLALGKDGPAAKTPALGGCVRLMTIHASKGLQAKVVVIAGIFSAGIRSVSNTTRNHLIVTPELITGRAKPWRSGSLSEHGLWLLAESLLHAQSEAEVRRLLYVSMTRVKSHLILVGNPGTTTFSEGGMIQSKHKPGARRSMGTMFLDALRACAIRNEVEYSPWLLPNDNEQQMLGPGSPERTLFLNPASLRSDSGIGLEGMPRFTLYHHPDCFMTNEVGEQGLLPRIRMHESALISAVPEEPQAVVIRRRRVRFAPSAVDTASKCIRRHWLEDQMAWPSEPLLPHPITQFNTGLPDAATLGTLFHRLIEIGLANPAIEILSTTAIPSDWRNTSENRLLDNDVIKQVIGEYSNGEWDEKITTQRLRELATLLLDGELGSACKTGHYGEWKVEGLRTEMPFDLGLVSNSDLLLHTWTPHGPIPKAMLDAVITSLTGRIDLVLALGKEDGTGAYLVVDLKTRGCGNRFDPLNPEKGSPLQRIPNMGQEMTTPEEHLLSEHRMQLALYSLALESIEYSKLESERRQILPPALQVSANGRLIAGDEKSMKEDRHELMRLLTKMAEMKVLEVGEEAAPRLSGKEAEECNNCPHYQSQIRTCGPAGEQLGFIESDLAADND
ncbi:MAG TPA: hypothetical protein EYQ85_06360 [Candidatus Poseidoniales archaeon]|nr:MAG: hypothetical protein CXT68_00495 [Euryarchaeota archaeon]HIF16857.1 hypothetical protein [Candidatus Poseidoniales archaeon]